MDQTLESKEQREKGESFKQRKTEWYLISSKKYLQCFSKARTFETSVEFSQRLDSISVMAFQLLPSQTPVMA